MSEKISLYGGPRDGQVMEWRGGDTAEFHIYEKMLAKPDFEAKNEPVPYKTALYKRSVKTLSIFVFQP